MLRLKPSSLTQKILLMFLLSMLVAFGLAMAALLGAELVEYRKSVLEDLNTQAKVMANATSKSLATADQRSATEVLSNLRGIENLETAVLYSKDGSVFSVYVRPGLVSVEAPKHAELDGRKIEGRHVSVMFSVTHGESRVGAIYLKSNLDEFYSRMAHKGLLAAAFSLAGVFLGLVMLSLMQRRISAPIYDLLGTMEKVSSQQDYSLRVKVHGQDELGRLAAGFNNMLSQIEKWNLQLEYHQQHLEKVVANRTADLEKTKKNLERALESEKRFIASMSHEMRTPLNSIIGFIDVLVAKITDPEQVGHLRNVQLSSNHLLSLVNDALDASKIDAGQMELRSIEFCMKDLLTECFTITSSRIKDQVQSVVEMENPPFFVMGDETRIKQIFINILGNAYKFTDRGFVRLNLLKFSVLSDDRVRFYISVEDSGVGIDRSKIDSLFSPFKQVHDGSFGGTGMGLFISRALARLMGGDIEVESTKGKGTKFTVILTLKKGEEKSHRKLLEESQGATSESNALVQFQGMKILLVEDIEMNVAVAEQIFKIFFNLGFEVAQNGQEAVQMAQSKSYDVIFMDIQMPVMDGITAAQEIRKLGITTPIVAMTANALSADVERAKAAGMTDYVTKPIKKEYIEKVLKTVKTT